MTWRIVTELMRRHYNKNLSIWELHPGGGQYDCISLFIKEGDFPWNNLCHFNQQSQHLHTSGYYLRPTLSLENLRWPDQNNYVDAFLSADDTKQVIDQVEQVLGLQSFKEKLLHLKYYRIALSRLY
ncbi:hypothetical protein ACOBQJ_02955 [Pelotomaculum propionicicum]|uniref:TY-Chap2 family putative peptide chaperone n=1 Tax=Pelotomaculum propionicicum TaxID=258475 RepID=UPI003B7E96A3